MHFHHTPAQAAGIARARGMLMTCNDPPACTVAALLAEHGCDDDDQPVTLARPSHTERVTCDAAIDIHDHGQPGTAPDLSPKFVQVAAEGVYNGYAGGAFTFDANTFAQLVRNLRADPAYVLGAGGVGIAPVCAWDFDHASAAFAADGSIPVTGAPAQGWVLDLDIRQGPDGLQLWALTDWLEPARGYILAGKYRWASVVVSFDCRDPKTNANIGARLDSIALTNSPFIAGMVPLAASRGGVPARQPTGVTTVQNLTLTLPQGVRLGSPEAAAHARIALSAIKLAAEVVKKGGPGDTNLASPDWKKHFNITDDQENRVLNAARDAGIAGASPEVAAAWLLRQPQSLTSDLKLEDGTRLGFWASWLTGSLRRESQSSLDAPNAPNLPAVQEMVTFSRTTIDATQAVGRNATERAINAMTAASPRFAALGFGERVHAATIALAARQVIA